MSAPNNGASLGFEDKLWAAGKLRGNMGTAEYKHVVLGSFFLKYISDAIMEKFNSLKADEFADLKDKDEYLVDNIFWGPPEARCDCLQGDTKRPETCMLVDDAMVAIERDNKPLKRVPRKDKIRPALDKAHLGEIINLIATIGLGDEKSRQQDTLGRVYGYFLASFAAAEGKLGGQFYAPQCVVRTFVEMLKLYKGRVFDPCCGSGGMFAVRQMTGSNGRQRVEPQSLSKFQLALPELDSLLFRAFGDLMQPLFNRIRHAMKQNRCLAGLADTLLPKFLSSEIELPAADELVERVT